MTLTTDETTGLFTRSDGTFAFARWGRPLAPVLFGVTDETISVFKGAIEAVAQLANHEVAETDPELGANLMIFFCRDWQELADTPNLDRMIPDLVQLVARLTAVEANQYRIFRFDPDGAIKACFVFLRMDRELSSVPAETLALSQVVQSMVLWSDTAFKTSSPLAVIPETGATILRPEISTLIRVAYDPVLPNASHDPSLGLRLGARLMQQ